MIVILKIAERCNLNCTYCYMYNSVDQSWRNRPSKISKSNIDKLLCRIEEYIETFPTSFVQLEIHGGEPLLYGKDSMKKLLSDIKNQFNEKVQICLQTNALLIDDEWIDMFESYSVSISVSCDGPPEIHDRYRKYHNGRNSGYKTETALLKIIESEKAKNIFKGVLIVIDPNTKSDSIVEYFYNMGINSIDLLLPDANHVNSPLHIENYSHNVLLNYLTTAFDKWIAISDPKFKIRIFSEIIKSIFGNVSNLDAFGGELSNMLVVESDGTYQNLDVLHICGEKYTVTEMSLHAHSFSDYQRLSLENRVAPCSKCLNCNFFSICGGGYLPHRFNGEHFDNPSFYCDVLFGLIKHIKSYIISVTPQNIWN